MREIMFWHDLGQNRHYLERDGIKEEVPPLTREYIGELAAENSRLQQELSIRQESEQEKVIEYLRQENADWEDKYRALVAENDKLRKLVSGLEYCVRASVCDYCCPLYDPSGTDHRRCESLERELRIEVD